MPHEVVLVKKLCSFGRSGDQTFGLFDMTVEDLGDVGAQLFAIKLEVFVGN